MGKKKLLKKYVSKGPYAVVLFKEKADKLYEVIPETWFVNECKTCCYWPPKSGKSITLRSMNSDEPDDTWEICECEVISEGHVTYSSGYLVVREKCKQDYNTSSADEHIQAAKFRREHPGLVSKGQKSFEDVFAAHKMPILQTDTNSSNKAHLKGISTESSKKVNSRSSFRDQSRSRKCKTLSPDSIPPKSSRSRSLRSSRNRLPEHSSRPSNSSSVDRFQSDQSRSRCGTIDRSSRENILKSKTSNGTENQSLKSKSRRKSTVIPRSGSSRSRTESARSRTEPARSRSGSRRSRSGSRRSRSGSRGSRSESRRSRSESRRSQSGSRRSRSGSRRSRSGSRRSRSGSRRSRSGSRRSRSGSRRSRSGSRRSQSGSRRSRRGSRRSRSGSTRSRSGSARSRSGSKRNRRGARRRQRGSRRSQYKRSSETKSQSKSRASSYCSSRSISKSRRSLSSFRQKKRRSSRSQILPTDESHRRMKLILTEVKELIADSNNKQVCYAHENDRRLARLEVTINKMFIMLGDMAKSLIATSSTACDRPKPPKGFRMPDIPLRSIRELTVMHRKLKDKEFRTFLLNHEKEFCSPGTSLKLTPNVVLTTYLKRFTSLKLRSSLTLKDLKGKKGLTLCGDFRRVYLFLIDVMKEGYRSSNKSIGFDEAHSTLRVVWGRSKQLLKDQEKNKSREHKKTKK